MTMVLSALKYEGSALMATGLLNDIYLNEVFPCYFVKADRYDKRRILLSFGGVFDIIKNRWVRQY